MDFQEVCGGGFDLMELAQDRDIWPTVVSTVMNLRFRSICGEFLDWLQRLVSFSGRNVLCGVTE
jgi:hypothetical protein